MNAVNLDDPQQMLQLELERLYDKNQLLPRIRQAFREETRFSFTTYFRELDIPEKFGFDLLAQMAVHKRATFATLHGCLRHHLDDDQATATMLEHCARADLMDWSQEDRRFIVLYTLTEELQRELDRFQYPLPMVIPPLALKTNLDSGYLTQRGSVILRDNHHEDDVCLDHLNRLNRMRFTLNLDTAQVIQNKWKNLDKRKSGETWEEFQKRRRAFKKYDSLAKDVISLLIQEGNLIHFTHKYDKRGRTYCMGHHSTYQGNDWNKAILEFADAERLED